MKIFRLISRQHFFNLLINIWVNCKQKLFLVQIESTLASNLAAFPKRSDVHANNPKVAFCAPAGIPLNVIYHLHLETNLVSQGNVKTRMTLYAISNVQEAKVLTQIRVD